MIGGLWTYYEDRINCPVYLNNLLTDVPFEAGLTVLHRGMSNIPADDSPWFLAATQETAQPGARPEADLPYHARLRGRLDDAIFADCENHDRIFLVEEVVTVFDQYVPDPPLNMWELPPDFAQWPRYEDESLGFSFSYLPDWQIERVDDPALLGSLLVRYPEWPNFPVMIRIYPQEPVLDDMGWALEPPQMAGISMMSFVQGDGVGAAMPHNQHLIGHIGETTPKPESRYLTVYFLGDSRTYEMALTFPMDFAASQWLMSGYGIIVESFRLDFLPDPTPTALPLPHVTPTPLPFSVPPSPPTETPTPTVTPLTAVPLTIQKFELRHIQEMNPGKRLTFDWATTGASGVCLVSGTARRLGPWWQLPPTGSSTVEIGSTLYRDPSFTLQTYTVGGYCSVPEASPTSPNQISQSVSFIWDCDLDYFFSPAPRRCPLEPAVLSTATEQLFENGRMIWLEVADEILVFFNNGQFLRYENSWQPGEPEADPTIVPPPGLYQPIRGFGKIWQEQQAVQEKLGWGLAPEQGYSAILQSEHHEGSSSGSPAYLRTLDNQIIWYFGFSSGSWGTDLP